MTSYRPSILVGCDGSAHSETALEWALEYARQTGGSLRLTSAWEWPTFQGAPITYGRWGPDHECRELVTRLRVSIGELSADRVSTAVLRGNPGHVLVDQAETADLLVVGTHGMGAVSRLMLGSVSTFCANHSPAPVAIVRKTYPPVRGVLVGVDGSDSARNALRWAMDYADLVGQQLRAIHVMEPAAVPVAPGVPAVVTYPSMSKHREAREWLHEFVAKAEADRGRHVAAGVACRVLIGNPTQVLPWESEGAILIVVGRRGSGGLHRLLVGSVAGALVHHGHSTVVLTPSS